MDNDGWVSGVWGNELQVLYVGLALPNASRRIHLSTTPPVLKSSSENRGQIIRPFPKIDSPLCSDWCSLQCALREPLGCPSYGGRSGCAWAHDEGVEPKARRQRASASSRVKREEPLAWARGGSTERTEGNAKSEAGDPKRQLISGNGIACSPRFSSCLGVPRLRRLGKV